MKECDLVMKGGIASGVVYPQGIVDLSRVYRFRQVGGASAGAIAAAFAAAAEMNRQGGGFDRLALIPAELATGLADLFQPYPQYRKLYNAVLNRLDAGSTPGLGFVLRHGWKLKRAVGYLPVTHFGVCPGVTMPGHHTAGLTDWLNQRLEYLAGRIPTVDAELPEQPLTFGMLEDAGVRLRLISTNLSKKRPESLPLGKGFDVAEAYINNILPPNVAAWIRGQSQSQRPNHYDIPHGRDMPVVLAVRMSLAFPLLFSAVPLYSVDRSLRPLTPECAEHIDKPRLNLFSDGGLSSNFPIHYFDALLPTRPTFGINLSEHHPCRHGDDPADGNGWQRIYLPADAGSGLSYGINPIKGIGSFLMALLNSAKDWQDSLQTRMSGYRERIVHIALKDNEGGANLNMSEETINHLVQLGALASERILSGHAHQPQQQPPFELQVHRWRRLLSSVDALTSTLEKFTTNYTDAAPGGDPAIGSMESFLDHLIEDFPGDEALWQRMGYRPDNVEELQKLQAKLAVLVQAAESWSELSPAASWKMPSPRPALVIRSQDI